MRKYGKYERMPDGTRAKPQPAKSVMLQTYFTSLLCMILCVTMFFGTTYAWFTSGVTSQNNEIYIGTLDVGLYKKTDAQPLDLSVAGNTLFDGGIRWEPGYTALETVIIRNEGDLAFQYDMTFANHGTEAQLLKKIGDNFQVYIHPGDYAEGEAKPTSFADIVANADSDTPTWRAIRLGQNVATLTDILNYEIPVLSDSITDVRADAVDPTAGETGPNDSKSTEHTYIIALHMNESADGKDIMGQKLRLNVKLRAYQKSSEPDSFGDDYDEARYVTNIHELQAAVDNAVNGAVIRFAKNIDGNVTVIQKPDIKFTIDGAQYALNGSVTVDGKSARYETAGLTLKNIVFNGVSGKNSGYIYLGTGDDNTRYTNNVTVKDCIFNGKDEGESRETAAVRSFTGIDRAGGDSCAFGIHVNLIITGACIKLHTGD